MKKTLLAAALLVGFAGAGVAQAETSVTLYGILDTGYGYENYSFDRDVPTVIRHQGTTRGWRHHRPHSYDYSFAGPDVGIDYKSHKSGLRDGTFNGNRWGLKGSEDLGDGLRAIFQLEASFSLAHGAGSGGFTRQSFVGLSSDNWGTFTMGRQYSAGVDTNLAANGVNLGDMDKVFGSTGLGSGTRVDNSFKYVTPDMSGFKLIALYGTGTDGDTANTTTNVTYDPLGYDETYSQETRGSRVSVGALYANGPIGVGASYDRQSVTGGDRDAMTSWQINGSYDFEVVKLSLAYGQDRGGKLGWNGAPGNYMNLSSTLRQANAGLPSGWSATIPGWLLGQDPTAFNDFKSNNYHVGLSAPVGTGTLYAGWNYSTSNLDDDDYMGDDAGNISTYHINYTYPLSKRTMVYAYGSYAKNLGYIRDLKGTEAGIGLNHKF